MPAIVIQPDHVRHPNGEKQSFSDRWRARAAASGFDVRMVDVFAPNILEQLDGCHGFMWRFGYPPFPRLFAKRLLPAIEQGRGMFVFGNFARYGGSGGSGSDSSGSDSSGSSGSFSGGGGDGGGGGASDSW